MKFYRKMTYYEKIKMFTELREDCLIKLKKSKNPKSINCLNDAINYYSNNIELLEKNHKLFSNFYTYRKGY